MATTRSPTELYDWVEKKAKEMSATPETKAYSASGALLPKKFHDELFPLAVFARHEYPLAEGVAITPNLDNDNYDARVSIGTGPTAQTIFIEITCAKDGYDDSLRMEVLLKEGHVSITGPISVKGKRGSPNRMVSVETKAADHLETLHNYFQLVEKTIKAKADKQYGRNFVLVVAVDDFYALIQDSDWPQLHEFIESRIKLLNLDFGKIVLIGNAGRLFLTLPID